ncbi:MAG: DUF2567 domain-containing protein [Geodermatophilaceae bacterium]|nr:DUF2567 domain-containing protein [Geodermatophilaceae bacterium]
MTPGSESFPPAGQPVGREATAAPPAAVQSAAVPPGAVPAAPWHQGLRPAAGEAAAAARLALVLLLAGIPLGVLWWAVAPRREYEVAEEGAFAIVPESEAAVGSDGWFMLLTGVVALAAAAVAWRRTAQRGPLMAVGLALGMLLCGLLTWQAGALLGPRPSAAALEEIGAVVLGPLGLRAYGVLLVAPFLAVAGYLLAVCFTQRDDLRVAGTRPADAVAPDPPAAGGAPGSVG